MVPAGLDVNLASPDGSMREWSVEHYIQVGALAAAVDARFLVIHPGRRHPSKPAPYKDARDWIIEGVPKAWRHLTKKKDEGVRPVFETTPSAIIDSAEECVEIVEAVGAERIGICYDLANGFMIEEPADGMREVADKLDLLHVSDTTRATWSTRQSVPVRSTSELSLTSSRNSGTPGGTWRRRSTVMSLARACERTSMHFGVPDGEASDE